MSDSKRFLLGGLGGLLPVLVAIVTIDLQVIFASTVESITVLAWVIKYTGLFILGGIVAALHADENVPAKLVELGIAAPALVATWGVANGVDQLTRPQAQPMSYFDVQIMRTATAEPINDFRWQGGEILAAGFLEELRHELGGAISGRSYAKAIRETPRAMKQEVPSPVAAPPVEPVTLAEPVDDKPASVRRASSITGVVITEYVSRSDAPAWQQLRQNVVSYRYE